MKSAPLGPSRMAAVILTALLLLLAFRLTASEVLRDSITQKTQTLRALDDTSPNNPGPIPFVGPSFTAAYLTIALFLAGTASFLAGRAGVLSRVRLLQLGLIGVILAALWISTFQAANRFGALIGTADIAVALLAAWMVAVLCHDAMLGAAGRRAVLAAVIAIVALGVGKAMLQHFVEYPDLMELMKEHKDELLRAQGIINDPAQEKLFMARLNSREVTGFSAFTNVFAAEMAGAVALLTAVLVAAWGTWKRPLEAPIPVRSKASSRNKRTFDSRASQGGEVPLPVVAYVILAALLALTMVVLMLTHSKGGIAVAVLGAGLLGLGGVFRDHVRAWRKTLLVLAAACAILAPVLVIAYGMVTHGLPSKSLLFRWHYWSATVPLVQEHPLWGVGLHNFGDYYMQYKLPASPEDVKDPHSFFVRLAAETGLPATALLAGLLLWLVAGTFRTARAGTPGDVPKTGLANGVLLGAVVAAMWVPLHLLAEAPTLYTVMLSTMFAAAGWGVYVGALYLLDKVSDAGNRYLAVAATIAALAMLLYDQVNMALVTGPAAMLFWVLLAVGNRENAKAESPNPRMALFTALPLTAAALGSLVWLTIPLAGESFSWDSAPYEFRYIRDVMAYQKARENPNATAEQRAAYLEKAAANISAALERWPDSGELLMQRILINRERHMPTVDDVKRILTLDRANAKPRLDLAVPDSDLPAAMRVETLEEALKLDLQLPEGEPKRLNAEQLKQVRDTLARLRLPQATTSTIPAKIEPSN